MIVKIPVSEHVKRFLKKDYGKEPIYVRADSKLGRLFGLSFSHGFSSTGLTMADIQDDSTTGEPDPHSKKTCECEFQVTFRIGRYNITPDNVAKMSLALDAEFEKAMYYFCKGRQVFHNSESAAVKHFLMLYGIKENDLSEETAIKMAQRERGARVHANV